ncbi:cation transporting ATPase C-terminal domain-containing protein [Ectothiorhodospira shaposhnikovii]|uniref:cation transporting ATPase C-terminal domain-containing protein n=1 Tax=Ectothiorhodospira shaposhnikovii TaxID=1054 RepID=UPI00399F8064
MIHIPLVATAALIPLLGYPLLYLPIHIVWLELIIHPTALLVFQNLYSHRPLGPPPSKGIRERFFDNRQWWTIVMVGSIVTLLVLGTYIRSLGADHAVDHARTMALLALIMAGAGITAALSNMRGIMAWSLVVGSPALAATFIHTPTLREILHLHPLHWDDWLIAMAGGALAAVLVCIGVHRHENRARSCQ